MKSCHSKSQKWGDKKKTWKENKIKTLSYSPSLKKNENANQKKLRSEKLIFSYVSRIMHSNQILSNMIWTKITEKQEKRSTNISFTSTWLNDSTNVQDLYLYQRWKKNMKLYQWTVTTKMKYKIQSYKFIFIHCVVALWCLTIIKALFC